MLTFNSSAKESLTDQAESLFAGLVSQYYDWCEELSFDIYFTTLVKRAGLYQ